MEELKRTGDQNAAVGCLGIWTTLLLYLGGKWWLERSRGFGKPIKSWLKPTWMSPGVGEGLPTGAKGLSNVLVKNTHILKLLFLFILLG